MEKGNQKSEKRNNFGNLLLYYREKNGLSLAELSALTKISPSYLNRIELQQRTGISINIIMKLSVALNIPIEELLKIFMPEEKIKRDELQSFGEILFYNKFTICGREIQVEEVEMIVDLIESVYEYIWIEGEKKNKEIEELLNLVDRLKAMS